MDEANEAGVQAVAFVLQANRVASTARNELARDLYDALIQAGVETSFSVALESGTADEALERFVARVEGILNDR